MAAGTRRGIDHVQRGGGRGRADADVAAVGDCHFRVGSDAAKLDELQTPEVVVHSPVGQRGKPALHEELGTIVTGGVKDPEKVVDIGEGALARLRSRCRRVPDLWLAPSVQAQNRQVEVELELICEVS